MKFNNHSLLALLAPAVLAQDATRTSSASSTTTSAEPTCTAELIAELCDYKEPGPEFAVAASRQSCLAYCDSHPPCAFAIFAETGNPSLDAGTCWLYPGETYDPSAGSPDGCNNKWVNVYDKPVCEGTPTEEESCAATATPSAIAQVCDYPTPPDDCWEDCRASSGASHCLSMCADADDCNYVVFNPHNESNTPYSSGTCWMYNNGTYNADAASTCSGDAEQYVYTNPCPKPPKPSTSSTSSAQTSATSSGAGAERTGANGEALGAEESEGEEEGAASAAGVSMTGMFVGFAALLWFGA